MQEAIVVPGQVARVAPRTLVLGRLADVVRREFRLRHAVVDTPTVGSMAAFFRDHEGPLLAFDFPNPNDNVTYRVRFGGEMQLEYFQPGFMRTGELTLVTVDS